MQLGRAILGRKSVRKFKDKKPDWRDIIECVDVTRYAPMAGDNFSLKFIIVENEETIQKLAKATQQDFINQAKYVVVACTNPLRTVNAYEKRGEMYCRQQAGAAIQNLLLRIEEKGLATCWVGHFVDQLVKEALKIPKEIDVEALFPIGYELNKKSTRRAKIELDRFLYFHKYGNKKMKNSRVINA